MDGIVVPHGDDELRENVWIASGPLAGGTICVVRKLRLDTTRFRALETAEREGIIGRTLSDGSPLSGGKPDDQVDLRAKTPEGEFLVPPRAHARAAHPSFTGSTLMLRRSYSFDDGGDDSGLLFISFQNELRVFTATQHRLDEVDDLMGFTTPLFSATFVMLPGFSADRPLGAQLA
jgi:dye decolorizing peroxidase